MGMGDALIAAGEARRVRVAGGPPVAVVDGKGRPWQHEIFAWCPDVGPLVEGAPTVAAGPKARPYIDYARSPDAKVRHAWQGFQPTPARLALSEHPRERTRFARGRIVVQPNLKARAPANKDWGFGRWQALVQRCPELPWLQVGQGLPDERRLEGVPFLPTPRAADLFAAVEQAAAVVAHEGFLHHAAAAVGTPAAVIYGGYIGPGATGYAGQRAFFRGAEIHPLGCGWKLPCEHCRACMEAITVEDVAEWVMALGTKDVPGAGFPVLLPSGQSPPRAAAPLPAGAETAPAEQGLQCWRGLWLPADETHLIEWMAKVNTVVDGKPTYQYHKLEAALAFCRQRRRAVDIGAHCGLWSMHLAKLFDRVEAFEPVDVHQDCFMRNVTASNVTLHAMALGEADSRVAMSTAPSSSGDTTIAGPGNILLRRLDDVLGAVDDVDFVKADCEGYELFALKGGEQLLRRCKPCIVVEQKPGKAPQFGLGERDAVAWLQQLGATVRREISGDFILSWE